MTDVLARMARQNEENGSAGSQVGDSILGGFGACIVGAALLWEMSGGWALPQWG